MKTARELTGNELHKHENCSYINSWTRTLPVKLTVNIRFLSLHKLDTGQFLLTRFRAQRV